MTAAMAEEMLRSLEGAFEVVRLIDPAENEAYTLTDGRLVKLTDSCFGFWSRTERCDNCVCFKAMETGQKQMKFELMGSDTYQITANVIEIDGRKLCVEMINRLADEVVFSTFGQEKFMRNLAAYHRMLYTDALTGAYNRRYYEEHQEALARANAIVMLDVDNFKSINDTCGHPTGDEALRGIVLAARANTRNMDDIIRYGGDEFLIAFQNIPEGALKNRLEQIRNAVHHLKLTNHPEVRLTVSMGAMYRQPGYSALPLESLVKAADEAMYEAKKTRDCAVVRKAED